MSPGSQTADTVIIHYHAASNNNTTTITHSRWRGSFLICSNPHSYENVTGSIKLVREGFVVGVE